MKSFLRAIPTVALLFILPVVVTAEENAAVLVENAFDYWRGVSSYSQFSMTIHRSDFERIIEMKGWSKGRGDALFFVISPAKDAGNGSLKKGRDMWNYNPKINRAIKLPASMMSQSWMGSDFSNDDLAKSDTILEDYNHRIVDTQAEGDHLVYTIESIAREEAPVIWGKQVLRIRDDHIILSQQFYDEDMVMVKKMIADELVIFSGRLFPKTWTMHRMDEEDRYTRLVYEQIQFGIETQDRMFTLATLTSKRRR